MSLKKRKKYRHGVRTSNKTNFSKFLDSFTKRFGESTKNSRGQVKKKLENLVSTEQVVQALKKSTFDSIKEDGIYNFVSNYYKEQDQVQTENPLHKYATYTYLFTLSGLRENELEDFSFLSNPVHDILARSSGIGDPNNRGQVYSSGDFIGPLRSSKDRANKAYRDSIGILGQGRDIFFEDVNIVSTVSPGPERGLADFARMEFKLHEPFGISFIEKVRAATRVNGYKDYQDAPLLLTIEFKGFDEEGIELPSNIIRKIPIILTRVDLDVNEGGAIYDISATRYQDIAFDDRYKFPRTKLSIQADTLEEAADQILKGLDKQMQQEIDNHYRTVKDEYVIQFDPRVLDYAGDFTGKDSIHASVAPKGYYENGDFMGDISGLSSDLEPPSNSNSKPIEVKKIDAEITSNTALTKVIEDLVRSTDGFENTAIDFWTNYLRGAGVIGDSEKATKETVGSVLKDQKRFNSILRENQYVPWFKIKTSVKTHSNQFDRITKMHKKTIGYHVIPHKIHVLRFIKPGISIPTEDLGNKENQVRRTYNYIYTGENTDVQNLRINYKTAFYQRNVVDTPGLVDGNVIRETEASIRQLGGEDYPEELTPLRQYPSTIKSRMVVNRLDRQDDRTSEMYDYLTNPIADMMNIDLEILGDPAYICQDQFIPMTTDGNRLSNGLDFSGDFESFNADDYSPLILLNYRLPDDINDETGVTFEKDTQTPSENLFFSGIYQIVKIESSFSQGQFTQSLNCVRLNNQNGKSQYQTQFSTDKKLVSKGSTKNNENISSVVKKPKYSWWYYIKNGGKKAVERRDEAIKEGINQAEDDR